MEQGNQNIPEKYSRGEHLKADTVNWLIDRAADSAAAKRVYKSDIEAYILDEIDEAAFDDSYQIPKPFDISCDVQQGVLAGVTLNNCLFYDGSEEVNLGNVDLTSFTNVSTIWLEKSLTATSNKYSITTTSTDTSASYFRLYDIDSTSGNFFVKCDYRDAHIEIGGISGGGGSGDCSCDVSAYFTSGDKLATWTNGTKTVDIYSNVLSSDIENIATRCFYTPFFYDANLNLIINNFFYVNRTLHEIHSSGYPVTQYGTYYLKISHYSNTDLYEIVEDTYTGLDTGGKQNTDSETFYKLWTIAPNFTFDWRQAPCIPFYERD